MYTPEIRDSLKNVVEKNKEKHPHLLTKAARRIQQARVAETEGRQLREVGNKPPEVPNPAPKTPSEAAKSAEKEKTLSRSKKINVHHQGVTTPEAAVPPATINLPRDFKLQQHFNPPQRAVQPNHSNSGFYQPHEIRNTLEQRYPGQVTSSTIPNATAKNVRLAGQRHPETGIVFDNRGFPIFDPVVKFDTRISHEIAMIDDRLIHMKSATQKLKESIRLGEVNPAQFSAKQLKQIQAGKAKISDFTWHHHQDTGRMQLIPEPIHAKTGHVGNFSLSGSSK